MRRILVGDHNCFLRCFLVSALLIRKREIDAGINAAGQALGFALKSIVGDKPLQWTRHTDDLV